MRNDMKVHYRDTSNPTGWIPEGSMRQQMSAYEALPPKAREALRNASYDHSPYQLLRASRIKGWSEADMVEAVKKADDKKRAALIKTGYQLPHVAA